MGRRPAITEEEVLAAARAVFLEKGIAGTTAEIAKRCRVSEATIFRRFASKDELFCLAMVSARAQWVDFVPDLRGRGGNPRDALTLMGKEVLRYYRKALPALSMILANPTVARRWEVAQRTTLIRETLKKAVIDYFAAEIDAGRIRARDAQRAAWLFFGSLMSFVMLDMINEDTRAISEDAYLSDLVDLLCAPEVTKDEMR